MGVLMLEGDLTIYQVAQLKPQLQAALDEAQRARQAVEIDLTACGECDGAGLQLILALARSAGESGLPLRLLHVPQAQRALLDMYGLAGRFELVEGGDEQ